MDNAECHMNIHAVEFAIQHGIVIVTLPPHTTDKLQPLDVSVFGPFKTYMRGQLNDYALMHPNKHITEHMLPEFASNAWNSACTPNNVLSGFRATGILPINCHIFADEAFVGAQVTERPAPSEDDIGGEVPTLDQELELTPVVCLSADDDDDELPPAMRSPRRVSGHSPRLFPVLMPRGERGYVPASSLKMKRPCLILGPRLKRRRRQRRRRKQQQKKERPKMPQQQRLRGKGGRSLTLKSSPVRRRMIQNQQCHSAGMTPPSIRTR